MKRKDIPRAAVTGAVVALFAFAYVSNPSDEMMKGALISGFSLAISYWLGSSKGSSDKQDQLERGQRVEVVNDPTNPVPVEGSVP